MRSTLRETVNSNKRSGDFPSYSKRFVHNLSSASLDKILLEVLPLGLKFHCLVMEVEFENLFSQLSDLVLISSRKAEKPKSSLVSSSYQYRDDRRVKRGLVTPQHLKQNETIDTFFFERMRSTATTMPRLHSLPKVHKDGAPMRPIVNRCNSLHRTLPKLLSSLPEQVRAVTTRYSVRGTSDLTNY